VNAYFLTDSLTMLRRSFRRMRRYPSLTVFMALIPVLILLLFAFVFGGTMGAGLGVPAGSRDAYIAYVMPGILLFTVVGTGQGIAISVAMDMNAGIIARFRTMAIARGAVLAGHVLGNVTQTLLAAGLVVIVALLVGFRPATGPVEWLAVVGVLALTSLAVSTLCVALGLTTDSVETASNLPMFLMIMLFVSSAFVPLATLPEPLQTIARLNPITPIVETVRGLLYGGMVGTDALLAVGWCAVVTFLSYVWAMRLYERLPSRAAAA